jgi:hypothetical protein
MKTLVIAIATLILLAPALAGAQNPPPQAPPATQAPAAPATPPAPAPAPGAPSAPGPESTTPRAQTPARPGSTAPRAPGAPAVPSDRVEGEILGMSPLVAVIFGLIVLGVIIALLASRRRDHDVVVETRVDTPLPPERPFGMPESEIERERRRRAS